MESTQSKYFDRHATFSRAYLAPVRELIGLCLRGAAIKYWTQYDNF